MASCGKQLFCTLCLEDDISNMAVTWCIDCETFLCINCERHHKRSKASKDHRNVSVQEYENLPSFILKTSNHCVEHDKRYELHCRFHESVCCVECINDRHKECRDLPLLNEIFGNIKSSAAMFHLEKELKDIKESFEEIEKILSYKTETLGNQNEKGVVKIQRMRKMINEHLDKLENQLLDKLSSEYNKLKSDTEKLMCKLEERRERIDHLRNDFLKMKTFATALQTFVGLKIIEEIKKEESKYIEGLRSSGEINTAYLDVSVSSALKSIENDVKSFGDISIRFTDISLKLKSDTEVCEQMPVTQVTDMAHRKPRLKKIIKMPKKQQTPSITGCQILLDSQILFLDRSNQCLMLFSNDGEYIRDIVTFDSKPWDMCYSNNNTAAVTLYTAEQVKIVDLKRNKIIKSLSTNSKCYGIVCDQQSVIINTGPYPNEVFFHKPR